MSRLRDMLVLTGVACAVSGSTFVLGQAQDVALPPPPAVVLPRPAEKKKEESAKADAAKKQTRVEAKPAANAKVAVKAMVVQFAPVVGQPAAAALDAQAAQYVQQFRPMFRAEYYFIRNTCGLNTDQRKQLARMGETAVKAAARSFVEAQQKMMRGGWRPGTEYPDPRKLIEQELTRVMSPLLTHDQESRYKAELEKRAASRKQVVIDNLVAKLDGDLVLTSDQRTRLVEALSANWKDAWGQSLEMLMNIDNFFPSIPDQVVTPILTDNQQEVWRRIPRNQNVFWGFSFGGVIRENDPLDDPELAEAQKEAEAKEKK
jgi:hypothetical protein